MLYYCYYDTNKKLGKREKLVYLISFKFRQICLFFNKARLPYFPIFNARMKKNCFTVLRQQKGLIPFVVPSNKKVITPSHNRQRIITHNYIKIIHLQAPINHLSIRADIVICCKNQLKTKEKGCGVPFSFLGV